MICAPLVPKVDHPECNYLQSRKLEMTHFQTKWVLHFFYCLDRIWNAPGNQRFVEGAVKTCDQNCCREREAGVSVEMGSARL